MPTLEVWMQKAIIPQPLRRGFAFALRNIHMKKDKTYTVGLDVHDLDKQQIEEKCQHFIEKLKLHCEPCGLESVLQAFEELIFHLREIRLNVVFKSKV